MKLSIETLESRLMCCTDYDLNNDCRLTSQDILTVMNAVNKGDISEGYDMNKDGYVTPIDALVGINAKNAQPNTMYDYYVQDADTVGFSEQQFLDAIDAAFAEYEHMADVGFNRLNTEQQTLSNTIIISTVEIYLGNGQHARGLQSAFNIWLHDGIIAPYHHSGRNGPIDQTLYSKVFDNESSIQAVFGHELGHLWGLSHSTDPTCRMNINAPPGFCDSEINYFVSLWGESKK